MLNVVIIEKFTQPSRSLIEECSKNGLAMGRIGLGWKIDEVLLYELAW
jgi:hypothetical protein